MDSLYTATTLLYIKKSHIIYILLLLVQNCVRTSKNSYLYLVINSKSQQKPNPKEKKQSVYKLPDFQKSLKSSAARKRRSQGLLLLYNTTTFKDIIYMCSNIHTYVLYHIECSPKNIQLFIVLIVEKKKNHFSLSHLSNILALFCLYCTTCMIFFSYLITF